MNEFFITLYNLLAEYSKLYTRLRHVRQQVAAISHSVCSASKASYCDKQPVSIQAIIGVISDDGECELFYILLYIELSNSFLIGRKHTVNFQNQRP